jgi:hypothetical protein
MKPSELIPMLRVALKKGYPCLVIGQPGAGKSDIITDIVNELGYDLMIEHPVTQDVVDIKGLPGILDGKAEWLPYGSLRAMMEATKPLAVFIDDLLHAPQSVQAGMLQLLLAREINGKKISPHVRFVAATNAKGHNAGTQNMISPLLNRFRCIINLEIDVDDWLKWGLDNGIIPELLAFIQFRPNMLNTFDEKKAKNMQPFASPRSVSFLNSWIKDGIMDIDVHKGCCGEDFAAEFAGFYQIFTRVGNLIPQIILNPKKTILLEEPSELYAITAAIAYKASLKNVDAIGEYIERYPADEYKTLCWKLMTARDKELCNSSAFQTWSIKNSDSIK